MQDNSKKIFDFIKSLFLPRKMARHMNMRFVLSLLILIIASCLNIVTSNTRAGKDTEKALEFPSLFEELPDDLVLTEMTTNEPMTRLTVEEANGSIEVTVDGVVQKIESLSKYLKADKNGVYHGVYESNEKVMDVTIVVDDETYSIDGTIDKPVYIDFFDIEGYLQQEKKENTEYVLYVLTLDNFFYLFNLDQIEDGKSTKAPTNSVMFETNDSGELKYYLPKDESELSLNQYGDFDTTKWTRIATSSDEIDFVATEDYFNTLNLSISFDQYREMTSTIKPAYRHLKNLTNTLYGGAIYYSSLESNGLDFGIFNTSFNTFQKDLKNAVIVYNAGLLKTTSLMISVVITLLFPLLLSAITWIMSRSFFMNKFRQYYAICSLCFAMTTIIALIAGFFVNYAEIAFALLVIASVYYIVATFRINTMEDDNNKDNNKDKNSDTKEPIKYSKISDDTTIIG